MSPDARPDAEALEANSRTPEEAALNEKGDTLSKVPDLSQDEEELFEELQAVEDLTDEDKATLDELIEKRAQYENAQKELKTLEEFLDRRETMRRYRERPLEYIYVRHLGRGPVGRAHRHARAGSRRQGVVLDNGLRIRKKGGQRLTQLNLKEFVVNHERLLTCLDNHILEILEPRSMRVLTRDELISGLKGLAERFDKDIVVPKQQVPYSLVSQLRSKRLKAKDEEDGGGENPVDPGRDPTVPDLDTSAVTAAVDQANAVRDGEANPPPSETGAGNEVDTSEDMKSEESPESGETTEEGVDTTVDMSDPLAELDAQMKGMNRKELDKFAAKQYGIKDAKKLPNMGAVIEAVLEVAKGKE